MVTLIMGILLIIFGILSFCKSHLRKNFYKKIKNNEIAGYKKTTGVVICDAYDITDVDEVAKPVTPIVEYEVNGEKYETQNPTLETGAELPVGTKVQVWYKKDNPIDSILGTELESHSFYTILGVLLVFFGLLFVFLNI